MHTLTRFRPDPFTQLALAAVLVAGLAGGLFGIAGSLRIVELRGDYTDACFLPPPLDSAGVGSIILLDQIARNSGRAS